MAVMQELGDFGESSNSNSNMENQNQAEEPGPSSSSAEESPSDNSTSDFKNDKRIVFPPPATWYKSSVAASRDDMWAYCSSGVIVLVFPPSPYPKAKVTFADEGLSTNVDGDEEKQTPSRWPKFALMGAQLEKYNTISFCQTSWDYLPIKGAPLVSGCERGIVRVWNLGLRSTVIYHDSHAVSLDK